MSRAAIQASVIARRDAKNAVITLGGQPTPADKQPALDEFKQLLAEVSAQKETLQQASSAAPFTAQGVQLY